MHVHVFFSRVHCGFVFWSSVYSLRYNYISWYCFSIYPRLSRRDMKPLMVYSDVQCDQYLVRSLMITFVLLTTDYFNDNPVWSPSWNVNEEHITLIVNLLLERHWWYDVQYPGGSITKLLKSVEFAAINIIPTTCLDIRATDVPARWIMYAPNWIFSFIVSVLVMINQITRTSKYDFSALWLHWWFNQTCSEQCLFFCPTGFAIFPNAQHVCFCLYSDSMRMLAEYPIIFVTLQ